MILIESHLKDIDSSIRKDALNGYTNTVFYISKKFIKKVEIEYIKQTLEKADFNITDVSDSNNYGYIIDWSKDRWWK